MSDEVRIKRERILLSKIAERYTEEQMYRWGNVNMMVGAVAITATHFLFLIFGIAPLDLLWQGILLSILVLVGLFSYRLYKQTKEERKVGLNVNPDQTFEEAHRDAVKRIEE